MKFGKGVFAYIAAAIFMVAAFCNGCASINSPDGGRYDEEPPVFKGSTPKRNATNVTPKNVTLDFDENIRIENAAEKVIVSPPMSQQPEILVLNKRIQIKLKDSLKTATTYSIDFADAIVDNNEGNPLGDFCFSFSTGDVLDTMEISGYVLNASDLEPIKGIQVGAYSDLSDTAFTTKPFERVAHTDAEGHFVMRGLRRGQYRVYALQDMDQNYYFSQKGEKIAWLDTVITTSCEPAVRLDSIFTDRGEFDSLQTVNYTRFTPDNLVLLAFNEKSEYQYITQNTRRSHEKFNVIFAIPQDTLPIVKGLNFDERDAFIIERSPGNDTITYWMSDTLLYYNDTLNVAMTYPVVDSTGVRAPKTDTLRLVPRKSRAQILQDAAKKAEEAAKELEKNIRRLERIGDTLSIAELLEPKIEYLDVTLDAGADMDINKIVTLTFNEPVKPFIADSVIHVEHLVDSVYEPMPIVLLQDSFNIRLYRLYAEWRPEEKYSITVDSAAIQGIYGLVNDKIKQDITVRSLKDYSIFAARVANPKPGYIVQLYTGKDMILRSEPVTEAGTAVFYFLEPGKYYIRLLDDANGNGVWDTGDYAAGIQPERVYYLNKEFDLKANWDHDMEPWNLNMTPIFEQKPDEAKTAETKSVEKRKSKNAERDDMIAERNAQKIQKKADRQERRLERKK